MGDLPPVSFAKGRDVDRETPRVVIEWQALKDLKPAPYNPRAISEEAMRGLDRSLTEFGLVQLIVWNRHTGHVVGGHQRLQLLRERGVERTQVVVVDLDLSREKALNLTLNNPAISGTFTDLIDPMIEEIRELYPRDFIEELRFGEIVTAAGEELPRHADPDDEETGGSGGQRECPKCGYRF